MKINPVFSLYRIARIPYLLPHGQGIADHKRGIRLNESGVFLWEQLCRHTDPAWVLEQFGAYCQAAPDELPLLERDLHSFLRQLADYDILTDPLASDLNGTSSAHFHTSFCPDPKPHPSTSQCIKIGPVHLRLTGPKEAFASDLMPFRCADIDRPDLAICIKAAGLSAPQQETVLIQSQTLRLSKTDGEYAMRFPQMPQIVGATLSIDGTRACIYYQPPITKTLSADLFHAVRFLFLYTAKKHGCYALHSASILYHKQAWLFSGPSGMGKSTHAALWNEHFHTPILNGDLNLLAFKDGVPVLYGLPWCGTSGIADTGCYPLGGIVLLNRGATDECLTLTEDRKILLSAHRLISPAWDGAMLQQSLDFMAALAAQTRICLLKCTKNRSAAETLKKWVDLQDY